MEAWHSYSPTTPQRGHIKTTNLLILLDELSQSKPHPADLESTGLISYFRALGEKNKKKKPEHPRETILTPPPPCLQVF